MLRRLLLALLLTAGAYAADCDRDSNTCFGINWTEATPASVANIDVHAKDKDGKTPLYWAAEFNANPAVITALLKAGGDLNARDKYGNMPLHWAASYNANPDVIIALLEAGADGKARDKAGKTPFDLAQDNDKLKDTDAYWRLNEAQYK